MNSLIQLFFTSLGFLLLCFVVFWMTKLLSWSAIVIPEKSNDEDIIEKK